MQSDAQLSSYKHFTLPHSESANHVSPVAVKKRQEWIDCLRGITMLLVIICHCEIYLTGNPSTITYFCGIFRMPLFFFISGYFAYSTGLHFHNRQKIIDSLRRRIKGVLIPTIIFCSLSCLLLTPLGQTNITDVLYDSHKGGYWFTLVSCEIFFLCIPLILIINVKSLKQSTKNIILIGVMIISAWLRNYIADYWENENAVNIISLQFTFQYMPYFILGILTRVNLSLLLRYLNRIIIIVFFISMFAVGAHYAPYMKYAYNDSRLLPFISLFLISIFLLFSRLQSVFNTSNRFGKPLSYIGRNTLPIYLIHYFIVFLLTSDIIQSIYSWKTVSLETVFPLTAICAVVVACLSLGINEILRLCKIRHFFFPKYK